jgi:hypothetical protein
MHHASGAAGSGKEIATDQPMPSYWEAGVPPDWSIEFKSGDDERLEASYANRRGFGTFGSIRLLERQLSVEWVIRN